MPGRGDSNEYVKLAAEQAEKTIKDHFEESSDAEKAAVIAGVFAVFAASVVPTYVFDTDY